MTAGVTENAFPPLAVPSRLPPLAASYQLTVWLKPAIVKPLEPPGHILDGVAAG